jgi:16S rRNA (uracil1498-N3)-methyltransferase
MQLFYAPDALNNNVLDQTNSQHCIKALRKKAGDLVDLVDGKGNFFQVKLTNEHPKKCEFSILSQCREVSRKRRVHIAMAPTKNNNRTEWFVEKAIEIGVDEISFIQTTNSERKHFSLDRIEKIAISAMKQSLKATLPILNSLVDFETFLAEQQNSIANKFVAHLRDDSTPLSKHLSSTNSLVLVGPEGDFTAEEIERAAQNKFQLVSLGNSRLRTETAAVVACTFLNIDD